jgi:hypothetical protein
VSRAAALALAVALVGCAHADVRIGARDVQPSTYRPIPSHLKRSVGLLRRLAAPPLRLETSPADPRYCMDRCDSEAFAAALASDAARMLTDWRGYEVVPVEASPELPAELDELARWARSADGDEPPEPLRALVRRIGGAVRCDGVMLLQVDLVYLTWLDAAAWYATLTFAIPFSMARVGTRLEADVFDTRGGRRVFGSRLRAGGSPEMELSHSGDLVDELFDRLELALPSVLTRPAS